MPDKNEVKEALRHCIIRHSDDNRRCHDCPRKDPNINCLNRLMIDALALLEADDADTDCKACKIDIGEEGEADG